MSHSSTFSRDLATGADGLLVEREGRRLVLAGDLVHVDQVEDLAARVAPAGLDEVGLDELDIDDGPALAALVGLLRRWAEPGPLVLDRAPQMLAHTLYKVGALRSGRLVLQAPRMDEGTTAN